MDPPFWILLEKKFSGFKTTKIFKIGPIATEIGQFEISAHNTDPFPKSGTFLTTGSQTRVSRTLSESGPQRPGMRPRGALCLGCVP